MMRYGNNSENDKYDITNSHQHLFETAASNDASYSRNAKPKYSANNFRLHHHHHQSDSDDGNRSNLDLTIVGYSCNLYRDDFNAIKIDSKNNLIPWNGDQNLLIDRYDCRGYLYDLKPHDGDLLNNEAKNPRLTNEEIEIERVCDEERYMFLTKDNDDEDSNEDDIKTSNRPYGSVKPCYENQNIEDSTNESKNHNESRTTVEQPFVPSENLNLPIGMLTPETVKMNHIIVKTASFVVNQGLQMEILLKAKQSLNSQFDFLNFDHHLNPYYKHLQNLFKTKQIDPTELLAIDEETATKNDDTSQNGNDNEKHESDEDEDGDDTYLHPLLSIGLQKKPETPTEEVKVETNDKLVEYDEKHDSENEQVETQIEIVEPKGDIKIMIDKMAEFVARNGLDFELNIKNRNEERFDFLKQDNVYFNYYQIKKDEAKKITKHSKNDCEDKASNDLKNRDKSQDEEEDTRSSSSNNSRVKHSKNASPSPASSRSDTSSSEDSDDERDRRRHRKRHHSKTRKHHKKHKHSSSSKHKSHRSSRGSERKRSRKRSRDKS